MARVGHPYDIDNDTLLDWCYTDKPGANGKECLRPMSYTRDLNALERQLHDLPAVTFEESAAYLAQLLRNPVFMTQLVPCLSQVNCAPEPYIPLSYGSRERSTCLQVFVWSAGATTAIHDHTSWGAYHCVVGSLVEQRYARLDNGMQPSIARLRQQWERAWCYKDGASMVQAYEHGIHRVANRGVHLAISVHLYGPRTGVFDGRDYDPRRDFVCDRLEFDQSSPPFPITV
jgi:predicted metal-dependent enzyme (double-stranded beta helix superfamily)